jgi:hypothetical protein
MEVIMKELEGKNVFLRPTGNNARYHSGKILIATINKVARVYATITLDGWSREEKFRINGNHLDNGHNGGYRVYASEKEVADEIFIEEAAGKISDKFRYRSDYTTLDRDTIIKVAELLKVEL